MLYPKRRYFLYLLSRFRVGENGENRLYGRAFSMQIVK